MCDKCQGCQAPANTWVSHHNKEPEWKNSRENYPGDKVWGKSFLVTLNPRTIEGIGEKQLCQHCATEVDRKEQAAKHRLQKCNQKRFKAEKAGQLPLL